jgi:hypothetical protein
VLGDHEAVGRFLDRRYFSRISPPLKLWLVSWLVIVTA